MSATYDAHQGVALRLAAADARDGAARVVHALPRDREPLAQLFLHAARQPARGLRRARPLSPALRRSDLLAGAVEQPLVRGRYHSAVDRARVADGALGQRSHRGPGFPAPCLFHADDPSDDRRGEHLAFLLYAGIRAARASARQVRCRNAQLARQQIDGAARNDGGDRVERGGILHDLLPRGAAVPVTASRGGRGDRGRIAVVFLPPRHFPAAHADHAVRAGQRGDQRIPSRRPYRRDDARRSGQRDGAAPLLHLRDWLPLLGFRVRRCTHDGVARSAGDCSPCPIRIPRAPDHYR